MCCLLFAVSIFARQLIRRQSIFFHEARDVRPDACDA